MNTSFTQTLDNLKLKNQKLLKVLRPETSLNPKEQHIQYMRILLYNPEPQCKKL